jgi:ribosomal protein L17
MRTASRVPVSLQAAIGVVILLFILALVSACAQLGMESPQTLNQKIAVTVSSVTAVRQSATTLLQAKKITVADAENVQATADQVIAAAKVAQQMATTDPTGAATKLETARTVLNALSAYLATKGGG